MKPRKYKYRIEVWRIIPGADGFGGNTVEDGDDELVSESWCKISTVPRDKLEDFGLDQNKKAIRVYLRKRNDLDYVGRSDLFLKYKGVRYTINSVTEVNLEDYDIRILASGD